MLNYSILCDKRKFTCSQLLSTDCHALVGRTKFGDTTVDLMQVYVTAPAAFTYCECCSSKFVKDNRIFFTLHSVVHQPPPTLQERQHLNNISALCYATWILGDALTKAFGDFLSPKQMIATSFSLPVWWQACVQKQATMTALSARVFSSSLKCFLFLCCLIIILCVSSVNGWWWLCKCAIGEQHG